MVCVCVVSGEWCGVRSLPRGAVWLTDRSAHQTESQTAHQSHQGEGVQTKGGADWALVSLLDCVQQPFNKLNFW